MTSVPPKAVSGPPTRTALRPRAAATRAAFAALVLRDLRVAARNPLELVPRTLLHPVLMVFVFTYVFPRIGLHIGAPGDGYTGVLVAGVVALAIVFQGIQSVALPLVQELSPAREIEARAMAPIPTSMIAVEKLVVGAAHSLVAALVVFPLAAVLPATPVHLDVDWPVLLTLAPLACVAAAALGLAFGTFFDPRTVPRLFGIVLLPVVFLGCVYYPWSQLGPIPWLKVAVLVNPLVYVSEGARGALVEDTSHMPLPAVYAGLVTLTVLLGAFGIRRFTDRVMA